uniref:RRM domain-containing protein n=1 Tax=Parastrongyloides trichosuri TaxID=131310 RepID=A0A0N5A4X7_PARTI
MVTRSKKSRAKKRSLPFGENENNSQNLIKKAYQEYYSTISDNSSSPNNVNYGVNFNNYGYDASRMMFPDNMNDTTSGYFFNSSNFTYDNRIFPSNYGYSYTNYHYSYPVVQHGHIYPHKLESSVPDNGPIAPKEEILNETLYITGIPYISTEQLLFNVFNFNNFIALSRNGVPRIKIYRNNQTNASCLITFTSRETAKFVKESLDRTEFPGTYKRLKIKYAVFKDSEKSQNINNINRTNIFEIEKNTKNDVKGNTLGGYIARFDTEDLKCNHVNNDKLTQQDNITNEKNNDTSSSELEEHLGNEKGC